MGHPRIMRAASDDDTMLDAERKASPFCAGRAIVVNEPEKRVCRQSDTEQTSPIGFIKEEIVRGKDGAEVSRTYYERNGWRDHGQARFYDKLEALVLHKVQGGGNKPL